MGKEHKTLFENLFQFVATNDDTPYFCLPAALKFRNEICGGEDRIYAYLEHLAKEAGDIVAKELGTDVLQEPGLVPGAPSQLRRCGMATIRLPIAIQGQSVSGELPCILLCEGEVRPTIDWFHITLIEKYRAFVPVFSHAGWLWTRLSAQVYLETRDFEWLADVLKEMLDSLQWRRSSRE
ncbi:Aminotransferase family protein LolT [Aspergillus sclerotialis]|uniref:Aminotransferase family protein LolT n=1 Tax=Aspergillus sclerotialis TaxID=2070753 RepID=A0A3A2ZWS0_9EURO|nr:Aminotransferase family protein LolT [Aspergillus sclerotialis]